MRFIKSSIRNKSLKRDNKNYIQEDLKMKTIFHVGQEVRVADPNHRYYGSILEISRVHNCAGRIRGGYQVVSLKGKRGWFSTEMLRPLEEVAEPSNGVKTIANPVVNEDAKNENKQPMTANELLNNIGEIIKNAAIKAYQYGDCKIKIGDRVITKSGETGTVTSLHRRVQRNTSFMIYFKRDSDKRVTVSSDRNLTVFDSVFTSATTKI